MTREIIEVKDLSVTFGRFQALNRVSFKLKSDAGVVRLIGPNGAGKTTLIHSILKQQKFQGILNLNCSIAYCPDMPDFEAQFTPIEVLKQTLYLKDEPLVLGKIEEILEKVGLKKAVMRPTGGFSRGMKQRLGIAVALIQDPDIIFLDEPTSALDPLGRKEVLSLIKKVSREKVVVVSSHILSDIQNIADNLLVLNEGNLLYRGSSKNFLEDYNREAVLKLGNSQQLQYTVTSLKKAGINAVLNSEQGVIVFPKEVINSVFKMILDTQLTVLFCGVDENGLDRAFENIVKFGPKYREALK